VTIVGKIIKRALDIVISIVGLVVALPVLVITAALIRFKIGSQVIFTQERPGYHGRIFSLYKFRTMTDDRDDNGVLLSDDLRLTPTGSTVRRYSLDELPQLVNVLMGDMSLVGPRPLLEEYLPLYSAEQMRRHDVRPGITGWAQVNGRNALEWPERFKLDIWYVDHQTLWLDLKIILLTVKKALLQDGINADGQATMSKFTGNETDNRIDMP